MDTPGWFFNVYIYTYIKFIKVSRLTFTTDVVEKVGSFSTIQILLDSFICSFVHWINPSINQSVSHSLTHSFIHFFLQLHDVQKISNHLTINLECWNFTIYVFLTCAKDIVPHNSVLMSLLGTSMGHADRHVSCICQGLARLLAIHIHDSPNATRVWLHGRIVKTLLLRNLVPMQSHLQRLTVTGRKEEPWGVESIRLRHQRMWKHSKITNKNCKCHKLVASVTMFQNIIPMNKFFRSLRPRWSVHVCMCVRVYV